MEFSEACLELVKIIQADKEDYYPERYALMLAEFHNELNNGETPRMALSLAKSSPNRADDKALIRQENES